jgi:hypothetical protein
VFAPRLITRTIGRCRRRIKKWGDFRHAATADRSRLLIFIVAHHAETTIEAVMRRIPTTLTENFEVEILIIGG